MLVDRVADVVGNSHEHNRQSLVDNQQIMDITLDGFNAESTVFICANIQKTDPIGYVEDVKRYAERLQLIDLSLSRLLATMDPNNRLVIMTDYGNDPAIGHSHHTREIVPVLVYQQGLASTQLGIRVMLSDTGTAICEFFDAAAPQNDYFFLSALCLTGDTL